MSPAGGAAPGRRVRSARTELEGAATRNGACAIRRVKFQANFNSSCRVAAGPAAGPFLRHDHGPVTAQEAAADEDDANPNGSPADPKMIERVPIDAEPCVLTATSSRRKLYKRNALDCLAARGIASGPAPGPAQWIGSTARERALIFQQIYGEESSEESFSCLARIESDVWNEAAGPIKRG